MESDRMDGDHPADYRVEHDSLGEIMVPTNVLWGPQTQRAVQNFPISGYPISKHPTFINAYLKTKAACAWANMKTGELSERQFELLDYACYNMEKTIEDGQYKDWTIDKLMEQFPVDVYQGGAGTSTNMNVNEVIANMMNLIESRSLGTFDELNHPNDVVNCSQSTNDTYPTAAKIALLEESRSVIKAGGRLSTVLRSWARHHENEIKLGRTQLQDAVPMTYAQEANAWASHVERALCVIDGCKTELATITLGGTAIGTGVLGGREFGKLATDRLSSFIKAGVDLQLDDDLVAGTTDMNAYVHLSGALRQLAVALGKLSDDLRLLVSGPRAGLMDYSIPAVQAGSSIMPGKVNPVIAEAMDQVTFRVLGADATVQAAAGGAQLQLCAFEPIMLHELLRAMELLEAAMDMMVGKCLSGLESTVTGSKHAEESISDVTGLVEIIGYDKCSLIAKTALKTGQTIFKVIEGKYSVDPEWFKDKNGKALSLEELENRVKPQSLIELF